MHDEAREAHGCRLPPHPVGRKEAREGGRDRRWMVVDQGGSGVVVGWLLERHLCRRSRRGEGELFAAVDSSWKWWWWWVLASELRGRECEQGEEGEEAESGGEAADKGRSKKAFPGPLRPSPFHFMLAECVVAL